MGESVQLLKMKQYTLNRLSQNGDIAFQNGSVSLTGSHTANGGTKNVYQNGYQGDRGYGDWDSAVSPPTSPTSPTTPTSPDDKPASATAIAGAQPRPQLVSRPSSVSSRAKPTFIPEHDIEIPKEGSLREFTADDMSTFLRYLGVEERIVSHVHKKGLDGKKFSKLKDSDLEALSMKNPIICHFRDRSGKGKGGKKKLPFML